MSPDTTTARVRQQSRLTVHIFSRGK